MRETQTHPLNGSSLSDIRIPARECCDAGRYRKLLQMAAQKLVTGLPRSLQRWSHGQTNRRSLPELDPRYVISFKMDILTMLTLKLDGNI